MDKQAAAQEVRQNILPFWQKMKDEENGGYYGEADFYGRPNPHANKGCIMHARILWTFSNAYRLFGDAEYAKHAAYARDYLSSVFYDRENGGLYWLADYKGKPLDTKKQFYNIAFGIYALSEHYRATGDGESLRLAMALFEVTETYGRDKTAGGYIEACACDWQGLEDYRLSDKDLNSPKSMNTNLHVMEAYTNLLRACEDPRVRNALQALADVTMEKIINPAWHFDLFFDNDWRVLTPGDVSYGHDIEGSWLLYDTALALGGETLINAAKHTALAIAEETHRIALDRENGGLLSGHNAAGHIHGKKEWWPQAEAVVGFYNAYELSGAEKFRETAAGIWELIQRSFVDTAHGDWHNELSLDNVPDPRMPKAGFWKCPYHNGRMCFQLYSRM